MIHRQSQSSGAEVQTIVTHGRALLAAGVRAAWEARLLSRDPDGLFSGVLGARDVEELLASIDAPAPAVRPQAGAPLEAPRLGTLVDSIGAPPLARDLVAVALAVEV